MRIELGAALLLLAVSLPASAEGDEPAAAEMLELTFDAPVGETVGHVDFSKDGRTGTCATFDGKGYLPLPEMTFDVPSRWTIALWVKGEPQHRTVVFGNNGDYWNQGSKIGGFALICNGNGALTAMHTTGARLKTNKRINYPVVLDGTWHHVVYVKDGARVSLFVDGDLTGAVDLPANQYLDGETSSFFLGGAPSYRNRAFFKGRVDELLLSRNALPLRMVKGLADGSVSHEDIRKAFPSAEELVRKYSDSLKLKSIHVSAKAREKRTGSWWRPFGTLEEARDCMRAMRAAGTFPERGMTVWMHGGVYMRDQSFVLSEQDGGTEHAPIVYRAARRGEVRLVAGRVIAPESWKPLGEAARKRVHPEADPDRIYELDLAELGLGQPDAESRSRLGLDLFANDRRQPIAQWPDLKENIRGKNDPGWTSCNGSKGERTFFFGKGGNPQRNKDLTNEVDLDGTKRSQRWMNAMDAGHDVWLKGFWRTPWAPRTIKIAEINPAEEWIRLTAVPPGGMGSKYTSAAVIDGKPQPWRVGTGHEKWLALNLLEEINLPGEWALDFKDGKIYYLPPAPLESLSMMISDLKEPAVVLKNVTDARFVGLTIEGCLDYGLVLRNCERVKIAGCTIKNVSQGINVAGGRDIAIQSNDIYETGVLGIRIANVGDRAKLVPGNILVDNNHIHHVGRVHFTGFMHISTAVGVTVSHNLMHDSPMGGVLHGALNNCLFEYNEIHNIALKESDTGTFYGTQRWSTYGNVFRYNFTHHGHRANGFYCDDGDSGNIHYNNIVHEAITALKFGGGHDNIGRNNLLIQNANQHIDDRGISRNYRLGTRYESRLRALKPFEEPWLSYGKELKEKFDLDTDLWSDVLDPKWMPEWPNGCKMIDNVSVANGPFKAPRHGRVEIARNAVIETIEEAGFYDYENMDLRTDNPLILEKFPNLNEVFPKIGLRKDEYRKKLPTRTEVGGLYNRGKGGDPWDEDQFVD